MLICVCVSDNPSGLKPKHRKDDEICRTSIPLSLDNDASCTKSSSEPILCFDRGYPGTWAGYLTRVVGSGIRTWCPAWVSGPGTWSAYPVCEPGPGTGPGSCSGTRPGIGYRVRVLGPGTWHGYPARDRGMGKNGATINDHLFERLCPK